MKKNYINIGLMLLSLVVVGTACKRSLPVPGNSAVSSMANNWWVTGYQPSHGYWQDGNGSTHLFITTYNSSSNATDSLWVNGLNYINGAFNLQTEMTCDLANFTFSSNNSYNWADAPNTVTVLNGKVFPKGGKSASGVVVDSIYMQALFSDDPGDTLTIEGVQRTGFDQDEYP